MSFHPIERREGEGGGQRAAGGHHAMDAVDAVLHVGCAPSVELSPPPAAYMTASSPAAEYSAVSEKLGLATTAGAP